MSYSAAPSLDAYVDNDLAALVKCGATDTLIAALNALGIRSGDVFLECRRDSLVAWAIRNRQTAVLRALIQRGIAIDRSFGALTPLQCAALHAHTDAVPLLLDAGADAFSLPWISAAHGAASVHMRLPLFIAIGAGVSSAAVVRELLLRAPQLANSCDWQRPVRALHEAVRCCNVEVVELLLGAHADVNAIEPDGSTALHWAVRQVEARRLTQLLLDAGASVDARANDDFTPLMRATNVDALRLLVERGADVNYHAANSRHNVFTALRGDDSTVLERVALLARAGGTLDAMTLRGVDRLAFATHWSHSQAVIWLLACDVDPDGQANIVDGVQQGVQSVVQRCRACDIAALFLAAGASMEDLSAKFARDELEKAMVVAQRQLISARFMLMRHRALEIAIALQSFRLPALLTTLILDEAHVLAPKVPMYLKWTLVTKVKHYRQ